MSAQQGEAQAVADLALDLARVESFRLDASLLESPLAAVLPAGKTLHSLKVLADEWRAYPERRAGVARLESLEAFTAHVLRFKSDNTAAFLSVDAKGGASLQAVYDYHPAGGDHTDAHWLKHRAVYQLGYSNEWRAWVEASQSSMLMGEFAQFLEDRIADVYLGDAAPALLELVASLELVLASAGLLVKLSRNFAVNVDTKVRDVRTLSSGEVSLVYEEAHRDGEGGSIKIPNAFLIAVPVFEGAPAYVSLVRLSYRVAGGQVRWSVRLHRPEATVRDSLLQIREKVAADAGVPTFDGKPEA